MVEHKFTYCINRFIYVVPQPGNITVLALGRCKVLVPALGEFVLVPAPTFSVRFSVRIRYPVLKQGIQCQHWVPHLGTVPHQGQILPVSALGAKMVPVPELGQCPNGG